MSRIKILSTVMAAAFAFGLGACAKTTTGALTKATAKTTKPAPVSPTPIAPTATANTVFQGTWETNCIDESRFTSTFNGNLMTWTIQTYSDENCTTASGSPITYQSHFTVTPLTGDAVYNQTITYTDGDFNGDTEEAVIDSVGLSFNDDNNVYVKQ